MDEDGFVRTTDPGESFSAVADDTRVDILRALWEMDDDTATFSDLREAVGIRDSGQFNYHLDKLTDRFVRKTADGYRLTLAGERVNGAILSGAYTMSGGFGPIELTDPCPSCGSARALSYEVDGILVTCEGCEISVSAGVPPGAFEGHDEDAVPTVANRYFRTIVRQFDGGFCRSCEGPVEPSVRPLGALLERAPPEHLRGFPMAVYTCQRCGNQLNADLGIAVVDHPAVVGFYYDRGVDVREASFWNLVVWDTDRTWIESQEPFRAAVRHEVAGDGITLTVDDSLDVVRVERDEEGA